MTTSKNILIFFACLLTCVSACLNGKYYWSWGRDVYLSIAFAAASAASGMMLNSRMSNNLKVTAGLAEYAHITNRLLDIDETNSVAALQELVKVADEAAKREAKRGGCGRLRCEKIYRRKDKLIVRLGKAQERDNLIERRKKAKLDYEKKDTQLKVFADLFKVGLGTIGTIIAVLAALALGSITRAG